jgi:hypothetical protein
MSSFFSIYLQTFTRPNRAFGQLLKTERYLQWSFGYMLIPIAGYTFTYVFLTIGNGAPSVFTPWLNISQEDYYAINRFLLAPSMLLAWLASSALMQVLSRLLRSNGSFEQTLSLIALSISVAMWGGLVHDLPMSFLSAIGVIDARQHEIDMNSPTMFRTLLWVCYSIYLVAFLVLFPKAIRMVHRFDLAKSITVGATGFLFFQLIFLVFNR